MVLRLGDPSKSLEIKWSVIPQKINSLFFQASMPTGVLLRDFQPIIPSFGTSVSIGLISFSEEARVALQAEKLHLISSEDGQQLLQS
jgi:hypothetical protein